MAIILELVVFELMIADELPISPRGLSFHFGKIGRIKSGNVFLGSDSLSSAGILQKSDSEAYDQRSMRNIFEISAPSLRIADVVGDL